MRQLASILSIGGSSRERLMAKAMMAAEFCSNISWAWGLFLLGLPFGRPRPHLLPGSKGRPRLICQLLRESQLSTTDIQPGDAPPHARVDDMLPEVIAPELHSSPGNVQELHRFPRCELPPFRNPRCAGFP